MTGITVLHLSTSDTDSGAGRAAYRLHKGLQSINVDSQMLVRAKFSFDRTVIPEKSLLTKVGPPLSSLPLKLYPRHHSGMFSPQWFPEVVSAKAARLNPKIIHLHWICNGFLQIESLAKFSQPLVWTLHDMWPLTGGCHYADDCRGYTDSCGSCPQLMSNHGWDLSRWIWQRKASKWKKLDLTIVSPSYWLAECAKSSSLLKEFPVKVVPHGLDLEKYKPISQPFAREVLGLPQDRKLILFGASPGTTGHSRKGYQFLQPALQQLSQREWQGSLDLVVFGASQPEKQVDLGFNVHYIGSLKDDTSLALVYSAADVVVVPSVQEAFGQVASEALACGTPVVAFAATGLKDIIDHQQNGYLAQPFDVDDLSRGIIWILEDGKHSHLRAAAREKAVREFDARLQAKRHLEIYQRLLKQ